MTLTAELNQKAKAILISGLGPVGYARFIQQYEEGSGDYTRDRHEWLGDGNASALHLEASQLAAAVELHRPRGAKMLGSDT